MSTLGTFANFAKLQPKPEPIRLNPIDLIKTTAEADTAEVFNPKVQQQYLQQLANKEKAEGIYKANALAKKVKNRRLAIGAGLGLAGLGTLGAIAYNNRDSRNRRAEMGFGSAFANFAEKVSPITGKKISGGLTGSTVGLTAEQIAGTGTAMSEEQLKRIRERASSRKKMSAEDIKATQERLKKYAGQRGVERNIDAGGDIYKGAKGMEYVTRTGALLGSPERALIQAGKASKNEFVQNLAKGAEKVGRLGYKPGAGVLNKVVGRTLTGKAARLGVAGLGLSAIGGAMKRNRQEQG